jgi:hypothetical protein
MFEIYEVFEATRKNATEMAFVTAMRKKIKQKFIEEFGIIHSENEDSEYEDTEESEIEE